VTHTLHKGAWAALALAFLCFALPVAAAPDYPKLTGRVVDQAGILSDAAEGKLTSWLEGLERDTGKQLVVATIKSLDGQAIEEYGVGLGRDWGIGQKDKDSGAILLVAPNDRQVRIEVGYGLEGELTDAQSRAIIEQQIIPSFKQGDFEGGIVNGTAAILNALGWQGAPQAQPVAGPAGDGAGIPFLYFGLFFLFVILRMIFGRRGRRGIWSTASSGWGGGGFSSGGGGFSGGGGSFGGGGASGRW